MSKKLVLVTGATGNQGGAVARALLKDGHRVRALSRNLDSPKAGKLKELGADLARGEFDDPASLRKAAEGVDAVFAMGTPFGGGVDVEVKQAMGLADAARAAGVKHLVYSSVSDADRKTGIPHFDSKYEVEKHIATLDIPSTIVAPVFFMDNYFFPHILEGIKQGVLGQQMPAARPLQVIPLEEIGRFASLVIGRGEPFYGKRINIASDELTGTEMATALAEVTGRAVSYKELPLAELRTQSDDMARMYDWFNRVGYSVDLQKLRKDYPEVKWRTFREWAGTQKWS